MMRLNKRGFTLLEVMVVVLIAVMITVASVPAYKKNQDKNRYLAASGMLMELGNAVNMFHEHDEYNTSSYSWTVAVNNSSANTGTISITGPINPQTFIGWLQTANYLKTLPLDSSGKYKGYSFYVNTGNTQTVSCCSSVTNKRWVACMSGSNENADYGCAWIDRWGTLTNLGDLDD